MNWMKAKRNAVIGILALGLVLTSTGIAWAAPAALGRSSAQRRPMMLGEITSLEASTIALKTRLGEITVLLDDETSYRRLDKEDVILADPKIGDRVAVRGRFEEDGVMRARLILIIPEGTAVLRGTVGSARNRVLKLLIGADEMEVFTNEDTRVFIPGLSEPKLSDLAAGTPVAIAGMKDNEGNFIACAIRAFLRAKKALVRGVVTAIDTNGFQMQTRRGESNVQVSEKTRFRILGVDEPSLEDLSKGEMVLVAGILNQDGAMLARMVGVLPERPRSEWIVGQIAAINGAALSVTLRSGHEINVLTDENTKILVPGLIEASMADLNVGDTVAVHGPTPQEEEIPYAASVVVLRDAEGRPAGVIGSLTAIAGHTVTVQPRSGDEIQLVVDDSTQVFVSGMDDATLADFRVGDVVGAQVVERDDGTLYASAFGKGSRARLRQGALLGRIETIERTNIKLTTRRGEITVRTDERTHFRLPGVEDPGLDGLKTGRIIGTAGYWEEDGSLHARIIRTHRRRLNVPPSER
jgi:hypothetical protein